MGLFGFGRARFSWGRFNLSLPVRCFFTKPTLSSLKNSNSLTLQTSLSNSIVSFLRPPLPWLSPTPDNRNCRKRVTTRRMAKCLLQTHHMMKPPPRLAPNWCCRPTSNAFAHEMNSTTV